MRLFFVTHQISTHSLFAECRKLRTLGKASRSLHVNVRENKTFSERQNYSVMHSRLLHVNVRENKT